MGIHAPKVLRKLRTLGGEGQEVFLRSEGVRILNILCRSADFLVILQSTIPQ